MEYQLKKEKCPTCETVLEATSEQPVDLDFSLPDYCPDIERILKCRICPSVTSKNISGDRLDVDGIAVIRLYYLDAKKQAIRICEHTSPFSCSFTLKEASQDFVPVVRLRTEYLNCRALSPRRLDIHGAFSVCAVVYKRAFREYCCNVEGDDIQQKKHSEQISSLCGIGQQQFSVSEVLDIGKGKASPESILRSELNVITDDCRAIDDKLMLKGEVILKILYITDIESGSQDIMSFHIPLSQIIDVHGINENTKNDICVDVMSYDVSLKSEYDESSTLVTLDARLSATVFAYEDKDISVIDDAYSTEYDLETGCKNESFCRLISDSRMTQSVSANISAGDNGLSKVIDIWCDSVSSITDTDNDQLHIKGKMNLCMLALDKNGTPFCSEKAADLVFSPETEDLCGKTNLSYTIVVPNISFRITDDSTVEVKAETRLCAGIYCVCTKKCIESVSSDENRVREKDKTAALTIYYADQGESLWDIARLYCTSVEALRMENNNIDDIFSERTMLLVPNKA